MRTPFLAGNWKMHKTHAEALELASALKASVGTAADRTVAIFPPSTALAAVASELSGTTIVVGAQDAHEASSGAFTGAVSMGQVADVGATHVLCGHSERRSIFGDDDATVGRKVEAALAAGLQPILCVGETLEERDAGEVNAVVHRQIDGGLSSVDAALYPRLTIAYEPVWAIGTGRTATVDQAQEVHASIRAHLTGRFGDAADATQILYGGSVKPGNAAELMNAADIDGVLVGGASLDAESFTAIVNFDNQ